MSIKFTAAFGNKDKVVKLTVPAGTSGVNYKVLIDGAYAGAINLMSDGYHVYLNESQMFTAVDDDILLDILEAEFIKEGKRFPVKQYKKYSLRLTMKLDLTGWSEIKSVYNIPIDIDNLYLAYDAESKLMYQSAFTSEFLVKMSLSKEITHYKRIMKLNKLGEITTGAKPFTLINGPYKIECFTGNKIDTFEAVSEVRWTEHGTKVYLAPGESYFDFSDSELVTISKV